jgi:hypothetical protein
MDSKNNNTDAQGTLGWPFPYLHLSNRVLKSAFLPLFGWNKQNSIFSSSDEVIQWTFGDINLLTVLQGIALTSFMITYGKLHLLLSCPNMGYNRRSL